jgi:hypothetical protein
MNAVDGISQTLLYDMPKFSRDTLTPIAALSVCYVNLNGSCDLHTEQLVRDYIADWRHPAPAHCRTGPPPKSEVIQYNRLGLNTSICKSAK